MIKRLLPQSLCDLYNRITWNVNADGWLVVNGGDRKVNGVSYSKLKVENGVCTVVKPITQYAIEGQVVVQFGSDLKDLSHVSKPKPAASFLSLDGNLLYVISQFLTEAEKDLFSGTCKQIYEGIEKANLFISQVRKQWLGNLQKIPYSIQQYFTNNYPISFLAEELQDRVHARLLIEKLYYYTGRFDIEDSYEAFCKPVKVDVFSKECKVIIEALFQKSSSDFTKEDMSVIRSLYSFYDLNEEDDSLLITKKIRALGACLKNKKMLVDKIISRDLGGVASKLDAENLLLLKKLILEAKDPLALIKDYYPMLNLWEIHENNDSWFSLNALHFLTYRPICSFLSFVGLFYGSIASIAGFLNLSVNFWSFFISALFLTVDSLKSHPLTLNELYFKKQAEVYSYFACGSLFCYLVLKLMKKYTELSKTVRAISLGFLVLAQWHLVMQIVSLASPPLPYIPSCCPPLKCFLNGSVV